MVMEYTRECTSSSSPRWDQPTVETNATIHLTAWDPDALPFDQHRHDIDNVQIPTRYPPADTGDFRFSKYLQKPLGCHGLALEIRMQLVGLSWAQNANHLAKP